MLPLVCAVCVCVGGSVDEEQEWAMRMKRNRENKHVKFRQLASMVVIGHEHKRILTWCIEFEV